MLNKLKTLILLCFCLLCLPVFALELNYTAQTEAEVYKPSKLIVGSITQFIVKAEPNSNVALLLYTEEEDDEPLVRVDGVIGANGVIELNLELPDDEDLIGKVANFDVYVWSGKGVNDVKQARVVGADGRGTDSCSLYIMPKPNKSNMPTFGHTMPGLGNISETMEALKQDHDYEDAYYHNKPLILRNLRAPELEEDDEE